MTRETFIDLHAHTTASDGSLAPAELVKKAAAEGIAALAVTDHDTVAGLAEARSAARQAGIELVNGMELSVKWDEGTFHLLGYLFEEGPGLSAGLAKLQALRHDRNMRMIDRLNHLGYPVSPAEVVAESGGGQVGRPHMAKALVKKGLVASVHDAFEKLLRRGRPAYVIVDRLEPWDAFSLVRKAGGVPVIAHPYQLRLGEEALDARIPEWKEAGLGGIEVQHSSHDAARQSFLEKLAAKHDLAATGGSDFHGDTKPDVHLGRAGGGARIPMSRLDELIPEKTVTATVAAGEWAEIAASLEQKTPEQILEWATARFSPRITMATAMGAEGCCLVAMVAKIGRPVRVFNLDTDYQFDETLDTRRRLEEKYGIAIESVHAKRTKAEIEAEFGPDLWKRDTTLCCRIRKVEPLRETVKGYAAWISAIRRDQTADRAQSAIVEWDPKFELVKINPLLNWTWKNVWSYIHTNDVPYNPLHDKGYPSIGCWPCTKPVAEGADMRDGRWGGEKKECGLHSR